MANGTRSFGTRPRCVDRLFLGWSRRRWARRAAACACATASCRRRSQSRIRQALESRSNVRAQLGRQRRTVAMSAAGRIGELVERRLGAAKHGRLGIVFVVVIHFDCNCNCCCCCCWCCCHRCVTAWRRTAERKARSRTQQDRFVTTSRLVFGWHRGSKLLASISSIRAARHGLSGRYGRHYGRFKRSPHYGCMAERS